MCSVLPNFHFCEKCEENVEHPHPFLKVNPYVSQKNLTTMMSGSQVKVGARDESGKQEKQSQKAKEPDRVDISSNANLGQSWKQMVGKFFDKKYGDQKPSNPWAMGESRSFCAKTKQRALLINRPTYVLEGQPGSILMPTIEIKNATQWGWKHGVFLGIDESTDYKRLGVELVHQPIDFQVKGQETFRLTVPIQILAQAQISDLVHDLNLTFRGPNGNPFGDLIPLQFRIVDRDPANPDLNEVQLTKLAIKLYEQKIAKSYEEGLAVITMTRGDYAKSAEILKKRE